MTIELKYNEDGGVIISGKGKITSSDIIDVNQRLYESEVKINSLRYQLWDFRKASGFDSATEALLKMATQDTQAAAINPNIIIAIVTPEDFGYGLSRMWQAFVAESELSSHVFRSMEDALFWLGTQVNKNSL